MAYQIRISDWSSDVCSSDLIFYYDSPQYRGTVKLPVSGGDTTFQSNDRWLNDLAKLERFAVRRGTLGFRGWKPKNTPIAGNALTHADFAPIFEQEGVDMRIRLDIATFAERQSLKRSLLVSADTDMITAMKQARISGIEIGLMQLQSDKRRVGTMRGSTSI